MKKLLLLLLTFGFFSNDSCAQADDNIVLGKNDKIYSKILNEDRRIMVYVPNGEMGIYSKKKYPVVYLLDGDAHFYSVVGMIQQLSSVNGNTICPEMIVVGIPNTNRTRDLTPTHVDVDLPYMDSTFSKPSGGGENFMAFIEKELIPHIDSLYPTQPYKMLIGHSFGGLTVMNALINHTSLFNAYVAIDPSMWWDKMNFLKTTKKALTNKKYAGVYLYLGIANTMSDGMTVARLPKDNNPDNNHIRSIFELDNHLKASKQNQLKYKSKYYNTDDHSSVPLITEYDALHFIFSYYPIKLTSKDYNDSTAASVDKYQKHYDLVSKEFGYTIKPNEDLINGMGYNALGQKHYQKAERLFKMNIANYPESFNVYDSYGDYFVAKKDTAHAIEQFKKTLAIKEVAETRKKLEELTKK
ncbi:alpha/beta hydrolase-fold protein [Emticicia sp. BO119]|uniref:alpha/beta hydrolase-fold protein n=1 Tax=Emticicia sp. BO119 TaxID=2757768 RepID=UPI0015F0F44A|nr:alpha/beta hydrolase-fold protein [Emticicia sp. BO119]MBA4853833.1 alpha/beta hydrolase [Emticicia sp. BO119]